MCDAINQTARDSRARSDNAPHKRPCVENRCNDMTLPTMRFDLQGTSSFVQVRYIRNKGIRYPKASTYR